MQFQPRQSKFHSLDPRSFDSSHFEQRPRRYPLLALFDLTLNLALCSAILAVACVLLGIILSHNSTAIMGQISYLTLRLLN